MKRLSSISIIVIGLIVLGVQPLFQAVSAALPPGLYDAVKAELSGLDWTPTTETQKLTSSSGLDNQGFGISLAVEGNTALIGAPYYTGTYPADGVVFVFTRSNGIWTQQAELRASDRAKEDYFGTEVALAGNIALIAASGQTFPNNGQGSVYVFVRSGASWTEQQQLVPSDGASGAIFGVEITMEGNTALIGRTDRAVNVFEYSNGSWNEQAKLTASDGEPGDDFGETLDLSGDTALIGADGDEINGNTFQGSAYVFVRNGAIWTEQAKLVASDGAMGDEFGWAMGIEGNTALISSRFHDVSDETNQQGAVYVFERNGTTWSEQYQFTSSDAIPDLHHFGASLALVGDTALIGAGGNTVEGTLGFGSAYVFVRRGGVWTEHEQLIPSDSQELDAFGGPLAMDGDTMLVGSHYIYYPFQGAVYVYSDVEIPPTPVGPTMTPSPTATLEPGASQLIQNGGFENLGGDGKPDQAPWIVKNGSSDKVTCNKDKDADGIPDKIVAYSGNCTFKFKNLPGEAGKLQQTINLSSIVPIVGDTLDLSFFARSKGGATVKAKVIFGYADDTQTKIAVETSGANTYTYFTGSGTITNTNIVKSKINFKSVQTSGVVYVDEVSLKHKTTVIGATETPTAEGTATETPTPEATSTEPPIDTPTVEATPTETPAPRLNSSKQ